MNPTEMDLASCRIDSACDREPGHGFITRSAEGKRIGAALSVVTSVSLRAKQTSYFYKRVVSSARTYGWSNASPTVLWIYTMTRKNPWNASHLKLSRKWFSTHGRSRCKRTDRPFTSVVFTTVKCPADVLVKHRSAVLDYTTVQWYPESQDAYKCSERRIQWTGKKSPERLN